MAGDPAQGIYNSGGVTLTDKVQAQLQVDSRGYLLTVPVPGSSTTSQAAFVSSASITRTADTNAYAANDVVGATTSATAAVQFASIGPAAGGEVMITTVGFEYDVTALPSGAAGFRLYFYNVTPPSALGDNVAWDLPSGDRASFQGYVDLGTPVDLGSTLYVETENINKQVTVPSGGILYAYLVTAAAYTPASASVLKATIHAIGL